MLQIATGKLFTLDVARTNRLRGVLYSNARFGFRERVIETAAGTLVSTTPEDGVQSLVFEMDECIEAHPSGKNILISHTLKPFLEDFAIVGTFGLDVMLSPDRELVRNLTPRRDEGELGLSRYVARVFNSVAVVLDDDIDAFKGFVSQLIRLERHRFLAAMQAMRTYVSALHRLPDSPTMAYALMVSAVEALAQAFDEFEPAWSDLDTRKRKAVDEALRDAPATVSEAVRAALISTEHLALNRRYRAFVTRYADGAYLRASATASRRLNRYELQPALRNAYRFRSEYLHTLKGLPDDIGKPHSDWETVMVEREPALTLRGLSRLTRHVIQRFIADGATVEAEPYNYLLETSGVRTALMSAEYWVGRPLLSPDQGRQRLEGLLEQCEAILTEAPGARLTDLRAMLSDVERLMPQAPQSDRPSLLALHYLFNGMVAESQETPDCQAFLDRWEASADTPSPETFIARTVFDNAAGWDAPTFRQAHDLYFEQRLRPSGFHAPRIFEAAAIMALAERVRETGDGDAARRLVADAVEVFPENAALAAAEVAFDPDVALDWRAILFPQSQPLEVKSELV